MKILHITTGANYAVTKDYIRFVNENFDTKEHTFLIVDKKENVPAELLEQENTIIIDVNKGRQFTIVLSYMKNPDLIILHSLCLSVYQQLLLLFYLPIMNKIVWVAWGMDLYQWRREDKGNILYKGRNLISYIFRTRIKYFVGIFPPDIEFFKKEFKSHAQTFYASYVGGLYNPLYKRELKLINLAQKMASNSCINIQIGHSCAAILNHIQVLNDLHKFKNENIKIYIPLSYGDMEYGNQVEQYAKTLFGDKVMCIREMMSKEDYMDFLSTIDIAIFDTPRQIGTGNISPLLYMEKKIFLPCRSIMYDYYKSLDIQICDYNKISDMSFERFIEPINGTNGKNYNKQCSQNKEMHIEMWQRVFEINQNGDI
jgi:dTDP-N-acetylfucosamine:lipid II N-acetylfucosaminyltransferase